MSPVYARPFGLLDDYLAAGNLNHELEADWNKMDLVFEMERSACLLFGVVTYGVYMTIFREDEEGSVLVWVPKRATTKKTFRFLIFCPFDLLLTGACSFPGYLDNTVAGGITGGMRPFECLIKESMEEASIGEAVARQHAKHVGVGSYFFRWVAVLLNLRSFKFDFATLALRGDGYALRSSTSLAAQKLS